MLIVSEGGTLKILVKFDSDLFYMNIIQQGNL